MNGLEGQLRIALQTVFHLNKQLELHEHQIKRLTDQVIDQVKQIQVITDEVVATFTAEDLKVKDVLNNEELKAFLTFATLKNYKPGELLRLCLTHYCPLELIIEQSRDRDLSN